MTPQAPPLDVACGMIVYATQGRRLSGTLRVSNEDFRVEEVLDLGEVSSQRREGSVPVYRVTKRGMDTPHAAHELAESLKSTVNFAGLKDSKAITTQFASARSSRAQDPLVVHGSKFDAERVGYLQRPISRGMMVGNRFRIAVRTEEDIRESTMDAFSRCEKREIPNFFGYQRFGLRSMVNHRVGKAILRRDFREAVITFLGEPRRGESEDAAEGRRLAREERYEQANLRFSARQDIERRMASRLSAKPEDYLGALRRVPLTARRLFVQSYQSYLLNTTLSRAVQSGLQLARAEPGDNWAEMTPEGLRTSKIRGVRETIVGHAVPLVQLVGYAFRNYGSRFDQIIVALLKEEGVEHSQFYIKEAEEMSNEGGFRHAPLLAKDTAFSVEGDRSILSFDLGKGEYATTLLREVLKPENPLTAGF